MKIELFYTPQGCTKGDGDRVNSRSDLARTKCARLDYAVEVGVLTLPSIAIDGEVVFASLPTCRQLRGELVKRSGKGA
jgi:hypothetical protein